MTKVCSNETSEEEGGLGGILKKAALKLGFGRFGKTKLRRYIGSRSGRHWTVR